MVGIGGRKRDGEKFGNNNTGCDMGCHFPERNHGM